MPTPFFGRVHGFHGIPWNSTDFLLSFTVNRPTAGQFRVRGISVDRLFYTLESGDKLLPGQTGGQQLAKHGGKWQHGILRYKHGPPGLGEIRASPMRGAGGQTGIPI